MPQDDIPLDSMSHAELLREIAGNLRYLRGLLTEFEPLLSAVRGNGNGNAVRAAGLRRAVKRGTGNAATPSH